MSASLLREAAALMRERAADAAGAWGAGPWSAGETGYDDRQGLTYDVHSAGALVTAAGCEELAAHIASWHPAVALAVADWLEDALDAHLHVRVGNYQSYLKALAVARAYLEESA